MSLGCAIISKKCGEVKFQQNWILFIVQTEKWDLLPHWKWSKCPVSLLWLCDTWGQQGLGHHLSPDHGPLCKLVNSVGQVNVQKDGSVITTFLGWRLHTHTSPHSRRGCRNQCCQSWQAPGDTGDSSLER
jgi:hypothetical protein